MTASYFLGIDLGGTNAKAGVTTNTGKLLGNASVPTGHKGDRSPAQVVASMVKAARQAVKKSKLALTDITAVGIASPGPLSSEKGIVIRSANLPGWHNVPLRALVSQQLQLPAFLDNDANAAGFGEYWAGVGKTKKVRHLVMFTLGTGVGGGIITDGMVVRGHQDFGGELGHMIVVPDGLLCPCGQRGCLEQYASASRTGQRATLLLRSSQRKSSLRKFLKKTDDQLTAAHVAAHAKKGDPFAVEVWETTCRYLAIACVNVCRIMDPQMIVLAGGMSLAGNTLLQPVRRHFQYQYWNMTPPTVDIEIATLGNDAGIVGAAGVAADAYTRITLAPIGK